MRTEIQAVFDKLAKEPHVVSVTTPTSPRALDSSPRTTRSPTRRSCSTCSRTTCPSISRRTCAPSRRTRTPTSSQVELGGYMFTDQTQPASEAIGVLAAMFILLIAFGSLLAMGLPIMTALFGIGIGLAHRQPARPRLDVPSFAPQVTAMIGIGVGIDYALFIGTRYREALHDGADPEARGRVRARHERAGRAVRRQHRRHLAARPVPDRRVVHPRPGGRRIARGAVRDGRRGHVAAGGARLRRAHDRQVRAPERAQAPRGRAQLLGPLEPRPAGAARGPRRSPACSCSSCSRYRCSRCGSASPTPATIRPSSRPAAPTTC